MSHFFLNQITDQKRWQFIEDYFLGKAEDELMQA